MADFTDAVTNLYFVAEEGQRRQTPEAIDDARKRRAERVKRTRTTFKTYLTDGIPFDLQGLFPGDALKGQIPPAVGKGKMWEADLDRQFREASAIFGSSADELAGILGGLAWLGPLRPAPQRYYSRSAAEDGETIGTRGADVAMHLFDNESEVDVVNDWLRRLEIPYGLRMVALGAIDGTATVGDLVAMVLQDRRLKVDTSPADVGFGVSQVLPVVVHLLAAQDSIVCVEQPEIHLHPRLQAELADLLIATTSADAQGNQAIIETHSEHLLLRIQRRIREGTLDHRDVSVLYVDLQEGDEEATAVELRLDEAGYFLDEWPQGFFDERLNELFGGDE
jgi:hypothetical protein